MLTVSIVMRAPVGATPLYSFRSWVPLLMIRVTTLSPSAICSSMLKWRSEKEARRSAIHRLTSSILPTFPGITSWSTKSGASNSSATSRFPWLASSSLKRRTRALLSTSTDTDVYSSSLPTRLSLQGRHHEHDATRRSSAHHPEPYSPECAEGAFCEVHLHDPVSV